MHPSAIVESGVESIRQTLAVCVLGRWGPFVVLPKPLQINTTQNLRRKFEIMPLDTRMQTPVVALGGTIGSWQMAQM